MKPTTFQLCLLSLTCLATPICGRPTETTQEFPPISNRSVNLHHASKLGLRDTGLTGGPYYYGDFTVHNYVVWLYVDTGSTDLVINQKYVPSDAYSGPSGNCREAYGSGKANGPGQIVSAPYHFADFDVQGLFCLWQPSTDVAGLLGLGFQTSSGQTVSAQTGDSPLYRFADAGMSSFAIYLNAAPGSGGVFSVNGYNPDYVPQGQNFVYEPIDQSQRHWNFPITGNYQVNGVSGSFGLTGAFVDSGNPTIGVPAPAASAIWSAVGANPTDGTYANCNPGGNPVTFTSASGNTYSIEAAHYVVHNPDGTCRNAFRPLAQAGAMQITLGTPFIKQYYTLFDYDNKRLGFVVTL